MRDTTQTRSIQLHFYIANNFGPDHQDTFAKLTAMLINCANVMTSNGIMLMSPYFQHTLVKESLAYLTKHYPEHSFEHFFQNVDDDNCYLVINNIHKHPELETTCGKYLHDQYMYSSRVQ